MQDAVTGVAALFQGAAADLIGLWVAAVLTLIVYSYLFADTPLFRLAQSIFVGVAAGYVVVVAWHGVLVPRFTLFRQAPLENLGFFLWLILGILLLIRKAPAAIGWLPKVPVAYLVGVGGALALGGALAGTVVPQVSGMLVSLDPRAWGGGSAGWEIALYQGVLLAGTLGTLLYFYFTTEEGSPMPGVWVRIARLWGGFGKWIIMIMFGAIFASMVMSRVSLLLGRLQFLLGDWLGLIP